MKDRNLFHPVDNIGNTFTVGAATSKIIADGLHEMKEISISHRKKKYSVYFMLLILSGRILTKIQYSFFFVIPRGVPLPHSNALQYYVKREKCKVDDVIFPSGCEARAINLDNRNIKIDIFTGATSVRSKNIFTAISRYPTGKHEITFLPLKPISLDSASWELRQSSRRS